MGSLPQEIRGGPYAVRAPLEAGEFRRAVGRFATGVTVLTTRDGDRHLGMTANSFVSVSLDPLLVLASIRRDAHFHAPLLAAGVWGVSVLAADMADASRHFSRRSRDRDQNGERGGEPSGARIDGWAHTLGPRTGVALLDGALSVFECRTVATHPGGDHTLVIGEVVYLDHGRDDVDPLLFYQGGYLAPPTPAPPTPRDGPSGR
ncbi:flavin reductase family protein [Frankia sp. AiPa1]|uniref:flavin reductase family protein n=1 Tax=Frankia sp. AiPa1 TaxID=573492 RepID=UPI0027E54EF8|nr:flavin reductase family protein [Frankia sp. AiPa1]